MDSVNYVDQTKFSVNPSNPSLLIYHPVIAALTDKQIHKYLTDKMKAIICLC